MEKWFGARNEYMEDCHVKFMKKYGHDVDKEEDVSSKDEESEEDSEYEEYRYRALQAR